MRKSEGGADIHIILYLHFDTYCKALDLETFMTNVNSLQLLFGNHSIQ